MSNAVCLHHAFNSIKAPEPEDARETTKASKRLKEMHSFFFSIDTHLHVSFLSYPWVQLAWQG